MMDIVEKISDSTYMKIAILLFLLLIFIEILICYVRKKNFYRLNDSIASLSCGVFEQILKFLEQGIVLIPYVWLYSNYSLFNLEKLSFAGTIIMAIVLFFAVDFSYYWFHRVSHERNFGWALHVPHHSSEEFNFTTALRQGMFQHYLSALFYLPLAVFGFPPLYFFLMLSLNTFYQFFIHTRLIGKMPPLIEAIFNTPSHHRVHHGQNRKYIDCNYAGVLIIWDKIFNTFQREENEPVFGITTPLQSFNPIKAQFQIINALLRNAYKTPFLIDKFRVFFMRPGVRPRGIKPRPTNKKGNNKNFIKFNPRLSVYESVIALFFFLMGILTALLVIMNNEGAFNVRVIFGGFSLLMLIISGSICSKSQTIKILISKRDR